MPGEPSNNGAGGKGGDGGTGGDGGNNGAGGDGGTPPANSGGEGGQVDLSNLTPEQINTVLEKNQDLWNSPRLKELREAKTKLTKLEQDQQAANEQKLKDEKKFEELSQQQAQTIGNLQKQIQDGAIDRTLISKLTPLGVVDLEAALKLVDRNKISVADDGTVSGIDEVVEALKTDKAYLFNTQGTPPKVGNPSNPGNNNGSGGVAKFKRSQLQDRKFYAENRDAILKAAAAGEIEDDL